MTLISVIMPVYNGAPFVEEAVQSVLSQAGGELQFIAVDDGSIDDSVTRLAAFGDAITVVRQTNQGPAAARNSGLARAEGQFISFIDADDVWTAGRLAQQLAHFDDNPTLDIVQGQLQYLHRVDDEWQLDGAPFFANSLSISLFRRAAFEQVGDFGSSLPLCEDVDWFFRAQRHGLKMHRHEQVVLHYRRHAANLTNDTDKMRRYTLLAVAKHRRALQQQLT